MYGRKGTNDMPFVAKHNVGATTHNPKSGMMDKTKMVMAVVKDPVTNKNSLEKVK